MASKTKRDFRPTLGPVRAGALVGVVLAGGEGRRMGPGVPKPLRRLGGRPMLAHVVERLRPQVMDLVVVANDPLPGTRALKVAVIPDPPDVQRAARRAVPAVGPDGAAVRLDARPRTRRADGAARTAARTHARGLVGEARGG